VTLESTLDLPPLLNYESTIREWLADPRGKAVFAPTYQTMRQKMNSTFGTDAEGTDDIGMDSDGFLLEMPVMSILQFQEKDWPKPAQAIVKDLLDELYGTQG